MWKRFIFWVQSALLDIFTYLGVKWHWPYRVLFWISSDPNKLLEQAHSSGNIAAYKILMAQALADGNTIRIVKLVDRGHKINPRYLSQIKNVDTLNLVLERYCNSIPQSYIDRALSFNVNTRHPDPEILEVLLKYGADINHRSPDFKRHTYFTVATCFYFLNPQHIAGLRSSMKLLCEYGANIMDVLNVTRVQLANENPFFLFPSPEFFGAAIYAGVPMDKGITPILEERVTTQGLRKQAEDFAQSLIPSEAMLAMMPGCIYPKRDAFVRVRDLVKFLRGMSLVCRGFNISIQQNGGFWVDKNMGDSSATITGQIAHLSTSVLAIYVSERKQGKTCRALTVAIVDRMLAPPKQAQEPSPHRSV